MTLGNNQLMNDDQVLNAVIERVGGSGKPVRFGFDELQAWPEGVHKLLVKAGLLVKGVQAQSLVCSGCENACAMPVVFTEGAQRAFIVCDDADKQDHMGRIAVELSRLGQWQASANQVAVVIAGLLGVDAKPVYQKESASYKLGMLKGRKGRRAVVLNNQPLALSINQHVIPVSELLYFEAGELAIDLAQVDEVLNASKPAAGKAYKPNTSKREAGKLATEAMYQDWKDAYLTLKKELPKKTDKWCSVQIAKMGISRGRDSETIRKRMK